MFRKTALEKLSSPEQLDQLMQVTSPKGWVALVAMGILLLTILIWSLIGKVPTKLPARGIIIHKGGVFVASARGEGNVVKILYRAGDRVEENALLALVRQPELELRISQSGMMLESLKQERAIIEGFQEEEIRKESEIFAQQQTTYQEMISDYQEQVGSLVERIETLEDLEKSGNAARPAILEVKNQLYGAQHDMANAKILLKQIRINQLASEERRALQARAKENEILQKQHELDYLNELLKLNTEIISPFNGLVLEVVVKEGQLISPNTPILSLQKEDQDLEARLFINSSDGKRVLPGNEVQLSPDSIRREEYGFLYAKVETVARFPTTPQGIRAILENDALVEEFSRHGAPIEITVRLLQDPMNTSGFQWSSVTGPPGQISSGTLCAADIVIATNRPIHMVLPMIKKAVSF